METKSGSRIFASECPFTGVACTKSTDTDEERGETRPLGVCSATSADGSPVVTCPERFKSAAVWRDLEQHLFPDTDGEFLVLEEGRLGDSGRIDLLPVVHREGEIVDFAAVEIQASYFSGSSIRGEFKTYMNRIDDGHPPEPPLGSRQMDYRSCVDKRLLPQLEEKVETMETWGRTFGVVLQSIALITRISRVGSGASQKTKRPFCSSTTTTSSRRHSTGSSSTRCSRRRWQRQMRRSASLLSPMKRSSSRTYGESSLGRGRSDIPFVQSVYDIVEPSHRLSRR